MGFMKYCYIH